MSEDLAVASFAEHLKDELLPAVKSTLGLSALDGNVLAASSGTYPSARLFELDAGADALEGVCQVQLSVRTQNIRLEAAKWESMRLRRAIRQALGFSLAQDPLQAWVPLLDYSTTPARVAGRLRVEPASSQLWATRSEGDGMIHAAMRLNLFFDEVKSDVDS